MKKIILGITIAVVVLLIAGLVVLGLSINGIVKSGVETFGPKLTQTEVKLDKVSLSLLSGGGQINGLVIGNPAGFQAPHAISVGMATLVVQPSSLLADKIVIRTIRVEAPEITLETGLNGTNLKQILANLKAASPTSETNAAPAAKATGPGKKLQLDEFLITGAKLTFTVSGLGSQIVPMPEIRLSNLGQGPEGITSAELTELVVAAIEKAAVKAAAENSDRIAKGATSLIKGMTGKTNNAAADAIGKGIGDMFKKK